MFSSRLLGYGVWTLLHARGLADSCGEAACWLIGRVAMLELSSSELVRALDAFPLPVALRTHDALHMASCVYLADHGQDVALTSYDRRMNAVARAMEIPPFDLEVSRTALSAGAVGTLGDTPVRAGHDTGGQ